MKPGNAIALDSDTLTIDQITLISVTFYDLDVFFSKIKKIRIFEVQTNRRFDEAQRPDRPLALSALDAGEALAPCALPVPHVLCALLVSFVMGALPVALVLLTISFARNGGFHSDDRFSLR